MSKRELRIFIWLSVAQAFIVIIWCILFRKSLPMPLITATVTIITAQLFFWFAAFAPRIGYKIAEENGKKSTSMSRSLPVLYLWMFMFGIGSIYSIISPIVQSEPERMIFFFVPFSMSVGAYLSIRRVKNTLEKKNS
jgi:hypothetical protein